MLNRTHSLLTAIIACALTASIASAQPKNVIFMVGDGMGPTQVEAAAMFNGAPLSFESLPYQGMVTTYAVNAAITDSAAAATALATGQKVNNSVISLTLPGDGSELTALLEHYQTRGSDTGPNLVLSNWNTTAPPNAATNIPVPTTSTILLISSLALLTRHRGNHPA